MSLSANRREYTLLLAAAFWWGCGTSQLALLAVVLKMHGMPPPVIAMVLSANSVATMLAALTSGSLASQYGAIRTLLLGGAVSLAAIASFPLTLEWPVLVALASFGRGFGFGLLTPSGQMFAQALADAGDRKRMIGMFTAMFVIPTFFGPAIGEWSLRVLGESGFFLLAVMPVAAGLVTALALPRDRDLPAPPSDAGDLALVKDRRLWLST